MDNNKLKEYLQDLVNQEIIHSDVRDDILHLALLKDFHENAWIPKIGFVYLGN